MTKKSKAAVQVATIECAIEGRNMILRLPIADDITPSKSGKTIVVASTHGPLRANVLIDGHAVTINANAYYRVKLAHGDMKK
jgi:hypothetical protein